MKIWVLENAKEQPASERKSDLEAEEIAQAIADAEQRAWTLKELAIASAQPEHFIEAGKAAETISSGIQRAGSMEDSGERDQALMTLARGLAQAEHFTDAKQAIQAIEEEQKRRWALGFLAIALARQQNFSKALQELGP